LGQYDADNQCQMIEDSNRILREQERRQREQDMDMIFKKR